MRPLSKDVKDLLVQDRSEGMTYANLSKKNIKFRCQVQEKYMKNIKVLDLMIAVNIFVEGSAVPLNWMRTTLQWK